MNPELLALITRLEKMPVNDICLMFGELEPREMRIVRSVLRWIIYELKAILPKDLPKE